MFLTLCKNTALQIVVGAGRGEGLEAWRLLFERYEPRLRTRYAAQFMKIMSFSLQRDFLERLGLWEREIQLYENGSGKELDAEFLIGAFMLRLFGGPMKIHLLMRVGVLRTWIDFRQEVLAITRAIMSAQETPTPMDIGVVGKGKGGKGKGRKGGQGKKYFKRGKMGHTQQNCWAGGNGGGNGGKAGSKKCDNCGKQGHTASSCWQKQGGKGKGGNANSASSQKTCWVCGKTGHLSKDCKNRVGAVTEGSGTAPSAAPLENASVDWASFNEFLDVGTLVESSDSEDPGLYALDEGCVDWHLTIDSGAAVSVVLEGWAPEHPLEPTALSSSGGHFLIANGGKVYDRGVQRLKIRMPGGTGLVLSMRCTGASKLLVALTDLAT